MDKIKKSTTQGINVLALTQAIIFSWTLKPQEYLEFSESELLDLLIDAGFIFAYEAVACQLRLHGRSPSARQDSVAGNIARSSLSLLTRLLECNPAQSIQSQTRIFGLLATIVNSRIEFPPDLARDIPFSREAIDSLTTAIFSYQSYYTLSELAKVLDRSDIHTPTLRSILHSVKNLKSPLQHRFEEISGKRPTITCIDKRMEEALEIVGQVTSLSQDGQISEAKLILNRGLEKFPSLLELHWYRQQFEESRVTSKTSLNLDPRLGCSSQENSRSVMLWQAPRAEIEQYRSFLTSCVHRLERPLDQETQQSLLRSCQILAKRLNAYEELHRLRLIREKQQTIGASFDPFYLTLLKTNIATYWNERSAEQTTMAEDIIKPPVPDIIILTGLPSPLLYAHKVIQSQLDQFGCKGITVSETKEIDRAILDSAYLETGIYSYPEVVDALKEKEITSARQFYLQNIAFSDPTGCSRIVIHVNQEAFRHLALLDRIFPRMTVIEILPELNHWISHCLEHINGFNCEFAIPSLPELVAYANDYFEIMTIWRKNLNHKIHTLQAGKWLNREPSTAHVTAEIQKALTYLENCYYKPLETSENHRWEEGEDGQLLRSLADSYIKSC